MSVPLYALTDTWNSGATVFTAIGLNVTNTASASGSLLMDLQVGGASRFKVDVNGNVSISGGNANFALLSSPNDQDLLLAGSGSSYVYLQRFGVLGACDVFVGSSSALGFSSAPAPATNGMDTALFRDGAAYIIGQRNGTHANGFRVYNTYTDGSNYERAAFDWTTTSNFLTLGPQAAGTGTLRSTIITGNTIQLPGEDRVTSDFSVTSSVTLVDVTGLSVPVLAGRTYSFQAVLFVTDAAAGGVQASIAGTATATAIQYTGWTVADNAIKGKANATALNTAVGGTTTTETSGIVVMIMGTITVNAAGNLTVRMAQQASNGTATIAKRGSYFMVHDMA